VSLLKLINETLYDTRDLRRFILAGMKYMKCTQPKVVTVKYSRQPAGHWGRASIGFWPFHDEDYSTRVFREGRNVLLTIPRDPEKLDYLRFAQVITHELDHTMGAQHKDMVYSVDLNISWHEGLTIGYYEKAVAPKLTDEQKKLARLAGIRRRAELNEAKTRKKVEHWKQKAASAQKNLSKWRTKLRAIERRKAAKRSKSGE
jgi:hypothetical protein